MKYEKKYIIEDSDMNIFTGAIGNDRKLKVIFYDKKEKKRKVISFDISGNPLINDFSNYISSNTMKNIKIILLFLLIQMVLLILMVIV